MGGDSRGQPAECDTPARRARVISKEVSEMLSSRQQNLRGRVWWRRGHATSSTGHRVRLVAAALCVAALPLPGKMVVDRAQAGVSEPVLTNVVNHWAYVVNHGSGSVSVINTATNTVTATIKIGSDPELEAMTPNGKRLYVANGGSDTVSVINTTTNRVAATIKVGPFPNGVAVTPDGRTVYVTNLNADTVSVISTATNRVTTTIRVGRAPIGVAVSPDGKRVYVTNNTPDTVSVINTATNRVTTTIKAGRAPNGVAVTPNGRRLYVADNLAGAVNVIDTTTSHVIATIPIGHDPWQVAVAPNGRRAYVSYGNNAMAVINTATNHVTSTVTVGNAPSGLGFPPNHKDVYVTNAGPANLPQNPCGTVSVVNTASNHITATITVQSEPDAVVFTPDRRPVGPSQPENRGACNTKPAEITNTRSRTATSTSSDTYTFVSAPDLHPPKLDVLEQKQGLAHGDLLVAVQGSPNPDERGPLILDGELQPVWFSNGGGGPVFEQETYEGHPVLVWAQGKKTSGNHGGGHAGSPHVTKIGRETLIVVNEQYRRVAKLNARSPWNVDGHDISIIGNDVWVPVDRTAKHQDLARYGGPKDASVFDVGIQEYRLSTGRLLRTWDPLTLGANRGVPLSASKESGRAPQYDPYHINSVQALPNGDVLVSMRNTWAVYLIDPRTDRIIWTLGGKDSTFKFGRGAKFDWQHDAQLIDPGQGGLGSDVELTVFDNNSSQGPARGLILRLNTTTDKATLVAAYRHHPPLTASVGGSMQVLSNGNALVGWGSPSAEFTEFSKSGSQLVDVGFPLGETIYRALLTDTWVGTPYYPPSGAVRGTTAYASWNGATEVANWEVLAGSSAGNLQVVAKHARTGFETAIKLAHTYALYEVRALSTAGRVLGTSKSFS